MKKKILVLFMMTMLVSMGGCGNQTEQKEHISETQDTSQSDKLPEEIATQENDNADAETGKSLIAYFTWADNTHVKNPEAVDVDATSSASVLAPGNVGLIASWLQEKTGADLFSIKVEDLYSSDYDEWFLQIL